ncbi:MAG: peptide deformylase [Geminicoccaceae bacterium]
MTLRKIARLGHPVLLARAQPVGDPTRPEIARLIEDMLETMQDAGGVGLAAPQVHESLRLILAVDPASAADGNPPTCHVLVDPVLEPVDGEMEDGFEGCLSIPGLRGLVPRHRRLRWRALDRDGAPREGLAEGFFARVLQHEVDHLDGVLYLSRMTDLRQIAFDRELPLLQAWRSRMEEVQE